MSLLDDVRIVVTPNGYKAGTLFAVKPTIAYGSELVVNGDFSEGYTGWTIEAVWTISGGAAHGNGASGSSQELKQTILEVGKTYEFSYEIRNRVSGSVELLNSGLGATTSNQVYTGIGIATSTELRFRPSSFNGDIYNVSVREFTGADMDVTRATAATRVDENGLVNYAEIIGDSVLTGNNSNFDTGIGSWITYNGATLVHSTDKLEVTLTSGQSGARIDTNSLISGGQAGKTFKVRARIWQGTTTSTALKIFIGGAQENITISSTPTYFEFELTATNTGMLTIYRAVSGDTGTYFIDDVTAKEVTRDNVPRIDYTGGGCPHILAEPQRTNLVTYSEVYGSGTFFSGTSGSVIDNTTSISPSGDANATQVTSTGAGKIQSGGLGLTQNTDYTLSFYAKNVDATAVTSRVLALGGSGGSNLTSVSYISELSTTEWTRITHSFNTGTNTTIYVYISNVLNSEGTIQLWGAQLEAGSYATSYIPTSGSTVTRNQDIFTRDGIGSLINSQEGVLFAELSAFNNDVSYRYLGLTDGSAQNRVIILYYDSANTIRAILSSGGTKYFDDTYTVTDITDFHKIAIKWKVNDFALWIDGVERAHDTSGSAPIGLNTLALDQAGTNNWFGKVKQLQVYESALTDDQIRKLTS